MTEATGEHVLVTLEQGVLTGVLNRPAKKNALDAAAIDALHALVQRAEVDPGVRVVALRGAGADFCAGLDLGELLASADRSIAANRDEALRFGTLFVQLRALPKPVVAVVRGRALAGGCGLATAADLVLAAESAQFGYPEVQRGFVPALVLTLLRRAVGEKLAFDLAVTGRLLTATEALQGGLVSRVYEDSDFEDQVADVLRVLAASSASSLALTKQHFYRLEGLDLEAAVRLAAEVNAVSRTTPDFRRALSAFLER